jgi:hypothetical protein
MRPQNTITFPRQLHPGAWWLWAIGLAAAASRTQNLVPLLLILVVGGLVVSARRSTAPWAKSYGAFHKLALLIIAIRIAFQALLSTGSQGPTVLFTLPSLPMLQVGAALAAVGVAVGGRRTGRTTYRPDPCALPEWLVAGCGAVAAAAMLVNLEVAPEQLTLASVTMVPPVPLIACAGILVAALPAVLAPPLPVVRSSPDVPTRLTEVAA